MWIIIRIYLFVYLFRPLFTNTNEELRIFYTGVEFYNQTEYGVWRRELHMELGLRNSWK